MTASTATGTSPDYPVELLLPVATEITCDISDTQRK